MISVRLLPLLLGDQETLAFAGAAGVDGPYRTAAGEMYSTGTAQGDLFATGTAAGQAYVAGGLIGEVGSQG